MRYAPLIEFCKQRQADEEIVTLDKRPVKNIP
jgi:hypothetical protein